MFAVCRLKRLKILKFNETFVFLSEKLHRCRMEIRHFHFRAVEERFRVECLIIFLLIYYMKAPGNGKINKMNKQKMARENVLIFKFNMYNYLSFDTIAEYPDINSLTSYHLKWWNEWRKKKRRNSLKNCLWRSLGLQSAISIHKLTN